MLKPNRIQDLSRNEQGLILSLDIGCLLIRPHSKHAVRISMQFGDEIPLHYAQPNADVESIAYLIQDWPTEMTPGLVEGDQLSLPLGEYQLTLNQNPLYFSLTRNGKVIYQDLPRRAFVLDNNQRRWHYHQRQDQDLYYGLGEKTGRLERSGRRFRMNNVDAVGYDPSCGDPLYKHIPFFVRYRPSDKHCIGIYYHNAHQCEFDIGSERSGYWGEYASYCVDGGQVDYILMFAQQPHQVLQEYLSITGFSAMPTKSSLGYMGSTMYYTELARDADQTVLGFVDECRKQSIPLSGFHLSSGYTKGVDGKRYTFNWNTHNFADPDGFIKQMAEKQQVLSPNVKPGLLTTHLLWTEFDQANAFIRTYDGHASKVEKFWGGDASFVDFSNPTARSLWSKYLRRSLIDKGVVSIWNDNNEFEMDGDAICDGDGQSQPASS
ncbi:TIM-barrel domain-containing protein, partial [Photobacterium sp. OFAV2-7]|uniref:TIM-barrel domain-containing protein n=1 Tax=Photobacterium sp. OFAV2-7 TaxID=2917748 RepID=UPI00272B9029